MLGTLRLLQEQMQSHFLYHPPSELLKAHALTLQTELAIVLKEIHAATHHEFPWYLMCNISSTQVQHIVAGIYGSTTPNVAMVGGWYSVDDDPLKTLASKRVITRAEHRINPHIGFINELRAYRVPGKVLSFMWQVPDSDGCLKWCLDASGQRAVMRYLVGLNNINNPPCILDVQVCDIGGVVVDHFPNTTPMAIVGRALNIRQILKTKFSNPLAHHVCIKIQDAHYATIGGVLDVTQ